MSAIESSGYIFTGEMTDANGLVHLRARYYDPNVGVFASLDPFEGVDSRPMSVNGYSYVEGNPINWINPSGMARIDIWAAAFIAPNKIEFPYGIDFYADWHGDNRSWHTLSDFNFYTPLSSRVWWSVTANTDMPGLGFSRAGAGKTSVTYAGLIGEVFTSEGQAPHPNPATVGWIASDDGCADAGLFVFMGDEARNPLISISPPIIIGYLIIFDFLKGIVAVSSLNSPFPWHELHIAIDGKTVFNDMQPPQGPRRDPADLFFQIGGIPQPKYDVKQNAFTPQPCKKAGTPSLKIIGLPPIITDESCLFK